MSQQRSETTVNENIADWIGLNSVSTGLSQGTISPPSLSETFVLFAQTWCRIGADIHPDNYTDPHSVAKLRVNVTLSHNKEFNKAFNCNRAIKKC